MLPEDEDRHLLRLCQQGDETALAQFIRRHQERVFRLAHRMLGDASLADEAAAQTFIKVWSRCGSWRGEAAPGTWLYRLAVRTTLDVRRSQRRWWRRFVPGLSAVASAQPHDQASDTSDTGSELADRLSAALRELSEADRALVHLVYQEERSLAEAAEVLDISLSAMKMRLSRTRQKLRTILSANVSKEKK